MLKYGLSFCIVTCIAAISIYVFKKQKDVKRQKNDINKVLFFNEKGRICLQHKSSSCKEPFCPFTKITYMVSFIDNAMETLDVCLYLLTVQSLANAFVKAFKRGVQIRVITDEDMSSSSGSQMIFLRKTGFNVRMRKSLFLMHHKFVIVDNSLLLTGSLNWTMQALCGNCDNLIITNHNEIVKQFCDEFNVLWEDLVA